MQPAHPIRLSLALNLSNLSDAEFKTLVIRMLQELIGYFNSIKKIQAVMKATLGEIKKKNYRELTVEGMKLRNKSMIWNTRKNLSLIHISEPTRQAS